MSYKSMINTELPQNLLIQPNNVFRAQAQLRTMHTIMY